MQVYNALALALVNAAATSIKKKGDTPNNWVARAVVEKVDHQPAVGTRNIKSIHVSCRAKTRQHIAATTGVDVWA